MRHHMLINPRHHGMYAILMLSAIPISHTIQYLSIPANALRQAQAFRQLYEHILRPKTNNSKGGLSIIYNADAEIAEITGPGSLRQREPIEGVTKH